MSNTLALILTVLLLAGNAYFVACEFALTASRPSRLEPLAESNPRAAKTLAASRNLNEMLAACQLGVTLCSVALDAGTAGRGTAPLSCFVIAAPR
ncbi:CNNM domain-containing protein [Actinotignum timonense]|nr:CNNM domain-containing protein [Actinotignum timonense]